MWWIIGISWVVWSVLNGVIADQKNRSAGGVFALSLLLSPLFGLIYIAAVPALPPKPEAAPVPITPEERLVVSKRMQIFQIAFFIAVGLGLLIALYASL